MRKLLQFVKTHYLYVVLAETSEEVFIYFVKQNEQNGSKYVKRENKIVLS